jgi:phage terminase large subunit-like protein
MRGAWRRQARLEQVAPAGDWTTWIFCGGRGAGKTRSGAEWIQERVYTGSRFVHLIAPTAADVRDVMLEGPAGILTIAAPHQRPIYQPSLRKVVWPNGAQALVFSADEPDRLRGPQCDTAWIDELCAMRTAVDVLDNMYFGLRVGKNPQCLVTTTPRPLKCFKALLARDGQDVRVTRSSSFANQQNLAPSFFRSIVAKYAGTRLGKQELEAELLTDTPGALWHLDRIEELRVSSAPHPLERVVVSIDPAVTFGPDSDETGIIVVGLGADGHAFVMDDRSGKYPPLEWAQRAIQAYRMYSADRIVAEVNNGGAMVEHTLRSVDPAIPFTAVHASRGKLARAEPISAMYEQGRVHHVGVFGPLEDQMTSYDGSRTGGSPDRLDAAVWGLTELMLGHPVGGYIREDSLLSQPQEGDARAPEGVPNFFTAVYASVAAAVGPDGPVAGAIYFAACGLGGEHEGQRLIYIMDWDLVEVNPVMLATWPAEVFRRSVELAMGRATAGHDTMLFLDADGLGQIVLDALPPERLGRVEYFDCEHWGDYTERVITAAGFVTSGRVRISPAAYEKIVSFKGVAKNHLLAQVTAFGLSEEKTPTGPLLVAFANGVIPIFTEPKSPQSVAAGRRR